MEAAACVWCENLCLGDGENELCFCKTPFTCAGPPLKIKQVHIASKQPLLTELVSVVVPANLLCFTHACL